MKKHFNLSNSQQPGSSWIAKLLLALTFFAPVLGVMTFSYITMQEAKKMLLDIKHIKKTYQYQQHDLEELRLQQEIDRKEDVHQWKRIISLEYEVLEPEVKLRTLENNRR